jgi:uncharacterized membrane protein YccC
LDRVNHCRYNETGVWLDKRTNLSRIFGTILGGFIAFGILSFVHDSTILGGLRYYCDAFGFSFTPTNYKVGATLTIYVIFIMEF